MSIGTSGRIVIEVEPEVKRHLYSALAREGMTLKNWFLREAQTYLASANHLAPELPHKNPPIQQNQKTR